MALLARYGDNMHSPKASAQSVIKKCSNQAGLHILVAPEGLTPANIKEQAKLLAAELKDIDENETRKAAAQLGISGDRSKWQWRAEQSR